VDLEITLHPNSEFQVTVVCRQRGHTYRLTQQSDLPVDMPTWLLRYLKLLLEQAHLKLFAAWSPMQLPMMHLFKVTERCTALAMLFQDLKRAETAELVYLYRNTDKNMKYTMKPLMFFCP